MEKYGKENNKNTRDLILKILMDLRNKLENIELEIEEYDKCPFKLDKLSNTIEFKDNFSSKNDKVIPSCKISISVDMRPMKNCKKETQYWLLVRVHLYHQQFQN